jgi:hypothetical protein
VVLWCWFTGQDDFHSVGVYDWKNGYLLCRATSFEAKSLCLEFNPNGTGLVQGGNEIIRFWDLDGRQMHYQDALLSSRAKLQPYLSAGWVGGHAVMGTTDGCLYRFLGNKLDSIVQVRSDHGKKSARPSVCSVWALMHPHKHTYIHTHTGAQWRREQHRPLQRRAVHRVHGRLREAVDSLLGVQADHRGQVSEDHLVQHPLRGLGLPARQAAHR